MELEVAGRHALLFDDDATSAFVNSPQALVPWNDDASLMIDRYDVRHLLQRIPSRASSSSRALQEDSGDGYSRADLDRERYRDLPTDDCGDGVAPSEIQKGASGSTHGTFQAVPFSYGSIDDSFGKKDSDVSLDSSGYHPPFPLPESLLNHLPPTEKVHQIIARTVLFVNAHGGQSEFVLRVKQGNNPAFGFLMPDHHLHCYFRFLVAHPELLNDAKKPGLVQEQKNTAAGIGENDNQSTRGVLSMIESVYGSGDDDNESDIVERSTLTASANATVTQPPRSTVDHAPIISSSETKSGVNSLLAAKDNKLSLRKNCSIVSISVGASQSKTRSGASMDEMSSKRHKGNMVEAGNLVVEPSMPLKDAIDKVVEFIVRNGKEFEEVLIKQDTAHGRFPFLLPNNLYHPYYLKILQEAYKSKIKTKSLSNQEDDSPRRTRCRTSQERESSTNPPEKSTKFEGHDAGRKEKYKVVIGSPKKDSQELLNESGKQSGVTADVAAAIVMAATRGLSSPSALTTKQPGSEKNMATLVNTSERLTYSSKHDIHFKLGGEHSNLHRSLQTDPKVCNLTSRLAFSDNLGTPSLSSIASQLAGDTISTNNVKVANVMAKHVVHVAANETDSSEASLTREQKLKAERLKRAKMFAALMKSGGNVKEKMLPAVDMQNGHQPAACDSGFAASVASDITEIDKESVSIERQVLDTKMKLADTSVAMKGESRNGTSASRLDTRTDLMKYQHSGSTSHLGRDDDTKHRKRHSSSHSKHQGSKDEDQYEKRSKSHHHRNYRHHSSYDDDHHHKSHRRKSKYLRDQDMEQLDDAGSSISVSSKDFSIRTKSSPQECQSHRESSIVRDDATEVSDELRAKVRAMLLATL